MPADTSNRTIVPWPGFVAGEGIADTSILGAMPPTWGSEDDAEYGSVNGWQTVCTVLEEPSLFLSASIWGGRLWLRFTNQEESIALPSDGFMPANGTQLSQPLFVVDGDFEEQGDGIPQEWIIVGKEDAMAAVTRPDGTWRTDIEVAPLLTFSTENIGAGDIVTIWMVVGDGMVSFLRTSASISGALGLKLGYGSDWMQRNSFCRFGRENLTRLDWYALNAAAPLPPGEYEDVISPRTAPSPWGNEEYTAPSVGDFVQGQGRVSTWGAAIIGDSEDSCAGAFPAEIRLYAGRHLAPSGWCVDAYLDGTGDLMQWVRDFYANGYSATSGGYNIWRMPQLALYDPDTVDGNGTHPEGRKEGDFDLLGDIVHASSLDQSKFTESWASEDWGAYATGPMVLASTVVTFPSGGRLALIIGGSWINDVLITESCYGSQTV